LALWQGAGVPVLLAGEPRLLRARARLARESPQSSAARLVPVVRRGAE
jgi:hypothetical protein